MLNFNISTRLPYGEYSVSVDKVELVASKEGNPRFDMWLHDLKKGEMVFLSCPLTDAFNINMVNSFLTDILQKVPDSMPITPNGNGFTHVHFSSYAQYGKVLSIVGAFLKDAEGILNIRYVQDKKHRPGHDEIIVDSVTDMKA